MGMVEIKLSGSFSGQPGFKTTAEEGGHVVAIKRGIEFLASQLGRAVVRDAQLTKEGEVPHLSPLGEDKSP